MRGKEKSIQRHSCDCRIVENETDERSGAKDLDPQQRDIHDVWLHLDWRILPMRGEGREIPPDWTWGTEGEMKEGSSSYVVREEQEPYFHILRVRMSEYIQSTNQIHWSRHTNIDWMQGFRSIIRYWEDYCLGMNSSDRLYIAAGRCLPCRWRWQGDGDLGPTCSPESESWRCRAMVEDSATPRTWVWHLRLAGSHKQNTVKDGLQREIALQFHFVRGQILRRI